MKSILLAAMAEARKSGLPAFDHVTEDESEGLATFRDAKGSPVGFMNLDDYRTLRAEMAK